MAVVEPGASFMGVSMKHVSLITVWKFGPGEKEREK